MYSEPLTWNGWILVLMAAAAFGCSTSGVRSFFSPTLPVGSLPANGLTGHGGSEVLMIDETEDRPTGAHGAPSGPT